ncbi:MAG: tRNA (adenosine(37)-N6)-threonylcarbamoyltransferase complex transferase subunit TsaD [Eubacteriales bacterium]
MNILGIETSCDETAAAVVQDGRKTLSSEIYSQIDIHQAYGGVVPEIASRNHTKKLPIIVKTALENASMTMADIDAVAVTAGPGLVGALLTGVAFAKGFAYANDKPLFQVNHIEGHISSNFLSHADLTPPMICLIVSGGHSHIVKVTDYGQYTLLGMTQDDAAGEAFDKVARVLGLAYPGGPNLERLAKSGDANAYAFPVAYRGETHLNFSFSGLKTAVINKLHQMDQKGEDYNKADVAASFQKNVVTVLADNTFEAAKREKMDVIALAGGVSANGALRAAFEKRAKENGFRLYMPKMEYCTDNAAMIASAAYFSQDVADLRLNANPSLKLDFV